MRRRYTTIRLCLSASWRRAQTSWPQLRCTPGRRSASGEYALRASLHAPRLLQMHHLCCAKFIHQLLFMLSSGPSSLYFIIAQATLCHPTTYPRRPLLAALKPLPPPQLSLLPMPHPHISPAVTLSTLTRTLNALYCRPPCAAVLRLPNAGWRYRPPLDDMERPSRSHQQNSRHGRRH